MPHSLFPEPFCSVLSRTGCEMLFSARICFASRVTALPTNEHHRLVYQNALRYLMNFSSTCVACANEKKITCSHSLRCVLLWRRPLALGCELKELGLTKVGNVCVSFSIAFFVCGNFFPIFIQWRLSHPACRLLSIVL